MIDDIPNEVHYGIIIYGDEDYDYEAFYEKEKWVERTKQLATCPGVSFKSFFMQPAKITVTVDMP